MFDFFEKKNSNCSDDPFSDYVYDLRFNSTGFKTNLYDVQKTNGVWDTLRVISPTFEPNFEKNNRENTPVELWTRNTIYWSRACED